MMISAALPCFFILSSEIGRRVNVRESGCPWSRLPVPDNSDHKGSGKKMMKWKKNGKWENRERIVVLGEGWASSPCKNLLSNGNMILPSLR
jgi:hypothetical protein